MVVTWLDSKVLLYFTVSKSDHEADDVGSTTNVSRICQQLCFLFALNRSVPKRSRVTGLQHTTHMLLDAMLERIRVYAGFTQLQSVQHPPTHAHARTHARARSRSLPRHLSASAVHGRLLIVPLQPLPTSLRVYVCITTTPRHSSFSFIRRVTITNSLSEIPDGDKHKFVHHYMRFLSTSYQFTVTYNDQLYQFSFV